MPNVCKVIFIFNFALVVVLVLVYTVYNHVYCFVLFPTGEHAEI